MRGTIAVIVRARSTPPVESSGHRNTALPRLFCAAIPAGLAAASIAAGSAVAYENGSPPAYTGGFGEQDCRACHSDYDLNEGDGRLKLEGWPDSYRAGKRYRVTLTLMNPSLQSAGFQASVRSESGVQSGTLSAVGERVQRIESDGIEYLQHTGDGRFSDEPGSISWTFEWLAPESGDAAVLNVAANASNDDLSALGDIIYTREERIERLSD